MRRVHPEIRNENLLPVVVRRAAAVAGLLAVACGGGGSGDRDGSEPPGGGTGAVGTGGGGGGTPGAGGSSPGAGGSGPGGGAGGAGGSGGGAGGTPGTPGVGLGTGPLEVCTGWASRAYAIDQGGSYTWVDETCPAGQGCVQGVCVPSSCSDECVLGSSSSGRKCELYDIASGDWVSTNDDDRTHDRSRTYEKWLRRDTDSLLHGGVVSVKYTSSNLSSVDSVYMGDTSLHTGLYLAAEAFRVSTTGSARARENVRKLVETINLWFNVHGDPGNLATIAAPAGDSKLRNWTNWDCNQYDRFCNHEYAGQKWDYVGDPSRDMYMGPLMGLFAAYQALGPYDEDIRTLIRNDLFTFAYELMRLRTLPFRVVLNGAPLGPFPTTTRFFIPEAGDMIDGAVELTVDLGNVGEADVRGGQEFLPMPSDLLRKIPGFEWIPDIPRAGSAVMVASILQTALAVTEGHPEFEPMRSEMFEFYYQNTDEFGNINTWLDLAKQWSFDDECDPAYFGINIAMIPLYNLGLLEPSEMHRQVLLNDVVQGRFWPEVHNDKNSFFSFIVSAIDPGLAAQAAPDAAQQLAGFPEPPRVLKSVDLTGKGKYQDREPGCSNEVSHQTAVDVIDRPAEYFLWHSPPWALKESGNTKQTYPGHDYLLAYWMGRQHGFIEDDTPTRCLRWR